MAAQVTFDWAPPQPPIERIGPAISYYGSKWQAAWRYPAPEYDTIVEPFAGGAGYALRWWDRDVRLFDVDEAVVGAWDFLIRSSESDILELPLWSDDYGDIKDVPVCQEARWLVAFWFGYANTYPLRRPSQYMRSGDSPEKCWGARRRAKLAQLAARISHWSVELRSWEELDTRSLEASWFVDPPYQDKGRHYRHSEVDFDHLARWCRSLKGQVMVCEQLPAAWLPFQNLAVINGANTAGGSSEVLWTNERAESGGDPCR